MPQGQGRQFLCLLNYIHQLVNRKEALVLSVMKVRVNKSQEGLKVQCALSEVRPVRSKKRLAMAQLSLKHLKQKCLLIEQQHKLEELEERKIKA